VIIVQIDVVMLEQELEVEEIRNRKDDGREQRSGGCMMKEVIEDEMSYH
jgi:hypothetical protein